MGLLDSLREDRETQIIVIVVVVVLVIAVVLGTLLFYRRPSDLKDVSYEMYRSGDHSFIDLKVEAEGGSLLFGPSPNYNFVSYIGYGGGSGGGSMWDEVHGDEYIKTLGPFKNGTEVWVFVSVNDVGGVEWEDFTVRIGEGSSVSDDLRIEKVSNVPSKIGLKESKDVDVKLKGADEDTRVELHIMFSYMEESIIPASSSGGGGGLIFETDDGYVATLDVMTHDESTPSSYSGILLFRISCYDENRSAVSRTYAVNISEN